MTDRELFVAALHLDAAGRAAFLNVACSDPAQRSQVESLLREHERPGGILEFSEPSNEQTLPPRPASDPRPTSDHFAKPGTIIAGRYKLVEEIGEGGMGSVWVAQQTEPVKRVVAVKLIKAGMDSKAVLARFDAERQALALMDHPNIARVLDGGATPDGRPFFVMELVKGVPITHFCDARRLTPRQRLELFIPVCQAIQHAHQKGVIHRDIKPSNVLIALYDDKPVPKVIDFGVAKATGQTLTEQSLMTAFGAVIGTPEYMSPEQAALNNLDIDTRSDVYSLGVLLYELLAGSPPFETNELKKAGLFEMLRVVREEEPPRPSTKLSTANKLPSISADRGTEPKKLAGILRNELDWIVMKALEKDRARRYETVNGLLGDVQRYLLGEAVQAHPPSAAYRLRKFARKYRAAITTVAAFAILLIGAAVMSGWLAVRARDAEKRADDKRLEAEQNAEKAKELSKSYQEMAEDAAVASDRAQRSARSLQVDLDLTELKSDSRIGILRLARDLKSHPEGFRWKDLEGRTMKTYVTGVDYYDPLDQFLTAAILVAGQDYTSLLPPITHDGQAVVNVQLSPDGQTLLTFGKDSTARLWDARTGQPIAILRKGDERVFNCGFSPDGRTVFTDDQTSVARFWDVPSGRLRSATTNRPSCYVVPEGSNAESIARTAVKLGDKRFLTKRFVATKQENGEYSQTFEGPVELWDAASSRLVAKLDVPHEDIQTIELQPGGRWITAPHNDTLLVFSADTGKLSHRLQLSGGETFSGAVATSPTGRRLAAVVYQSAGVAFTQFCTRVWDTESWQSDATFTEIGGIGNLNFWADDLLGVEMSAFGNPFGMSSFQHVHRLGQPPSSFDVTNHICLPLVPNGDFLLTGDGILDTKSGERLTPQTGRRFHPTLARFSADGRFVVTKQNVIDMNPEKEFQTVQWPGSLDYVPVPGLGFVAVSAGDWNATIRLFPTKVLNDIPADLLELWAQVAVCGELSTDGQFVKWSEQTWEQKRQKLAAAVAPVQGLPFPGYVATDKLHWLRSEFDDAKTDREKLRIARELLRRAELAGDRSESMRWKAQITSLTPSVWY